MLMNGGMFECSYEALITIAEPIKRSIRRVAE